MNQLPAAQQAYLAQLREQVDLPAQEELDRWEADWAPWRELLLPGEQDEPLQLAGPEGEATGRYAPRWLCHLLGLRHRAVHILLRWESPAQGTMLVLQVRGWNRADAPGRLDISVGGHVAGYETDFRVTARRELEEELGLSMTDLAGGRLRYLGGHEIRNHWPGTQMYNCEWAECFDAQLLPDRLGAIRFPDGEVAGLFLYPATDGLTLLQQNKQSLAAALRYSLERFL